MSVTVSIKKLGQLFSRQSGRLGSRRDDDKGISKAHLKAALDSTQTAMMIVDRDLRITYFNRQSLELFKKNERVFQSIWPDFRASNDFLMGRCIDGFHKEPAHQRKLLSDPNNLPYQTDITIGPLKLELTVGAIMDGDGQYVGSSLEWADVTGLRRQEGDIARLRSTVDQVQTAIVTIDRDFLITYVNQSSLDLFTSHQDKFRKVWPDFKAETSWLMGRCIDEFHQRPEHQRKLLANPDNLPYRTDIRIDDVLIELNVSTIFDAKGGYIGNTLEWRDVTAERARQLEVGRLTSAVMGMTTNLMMADLDGRIVFMNPSLEKLLKSREAALAQIFPGFEVAKLLGENIDCFHKNPRHQRGIINDPDRLPHSANIRVGELEFELIVIAMRDGGGKHIGTAVQWLDITEVQDAQRQVASLIAKATEGELTERINVSQYQGFMKNLGEGINSLLEAIVTPISDSIEVMSAMAQGDLNQTMSDRFGGEFGRLATAVNTSIENLRDMVAQINTASAKVTNASTEIAQGNNDLSQRTEEQASSLEETAASMEELSAQVKNSADNARLASRQAQEAMGRARDGGEVVTQAVGAMTEIESASRKIADIIGVIDEIAFQTNLLALNAAVEAARAGEQGRGFAVVASEVRNLAQRSAGAAKEIKALIQDSVAKVSQGSKLVGDSGHRLTEIVTAVEEVTKLMKEIDIASQEQATGIDEVTRAVTQMDEMTQQNAALVEEAAASSESLLDEARQLVQLMAFFNGEMLEQTPPVVAAKRTAPAAKVKAKASASNAKTSKAKLADEGEEWEAF
ncbi:aerotaxis transducer Aer2 [Gallaecimonas pentaromativorans]|uniref:Methyl-accepting chemotaxis protein n=1 Tax=Gallaecimonas pentaromativorans TaxID=584787 RepID=A0A3N1P9U1_9GAMM|nr:aerotaxis transducer Aer2 [Gallaecimonas pentaromativorans]ROQ24809.1 methyl-accepting chemotaxis protein [Gallaecimonas pentaromativorans]